MISIFSASAFLSALSHISYSSRLESFRRFAFGVLLFFVVCNPVLSVFDGLGGDFEDIFPQIPSADDTAGEEIFEKSFADGIKSAVCEKFSLKYDEVRVLCDGFSKEDYTAEKIRIILCGRAASSDYREIEKYINEMDIGECRVEIEIG